MESIAQKNISNNITSVNKKPHNEFLFFIDENEDTKNKKFNFMQSFLAQPTLPLIGHYTHSDYNFGKILLMTTFSFDILQGPNKKDISNSYKDFIPPKEIVDYLNIDQILEIENNTTSKNQNFFYPKNKIKFFFVISTLPQYKNFDNKIIPLNLVPHLYLGGSEELFEKGKSRTTFEYPICLFTTKPYNDNIVFYDNERSINKNDLRYEYNSIHMKKGSLALSPYNLSFGVNTNCNMSQFYICICQKDKNWHSVFYYVVINNEQTKKNVENILKSANNLKDVIYEMKNKFNKSDPDITGNLSSLFKID